MRKTALRALAAAPALALVLSAAALHPRGAAAATLCVPAVGADGCAGDVVAADVADAVARADAAPGPDAIVVGAGVHDLGHGVRVEQPDTELRGVGRERTVLTMRALQPNAGTTERIVDGVPARLADLTLRLPSADLSSGSAGAVLAADLVGTAVERVRIDAEGAVFGPEHDDGSGEGLQLDGGSVRDVEIAFGQGRDLRGARFSTRATGAPVEVDGLRVDSPFALAAGGEPTPEGAIPPVRLARVALRGRSPLYVLHGAVELRDSVVEALPAPPAAPGDEEAYERAIAFGSMARRPGALRLDRVTIVGRGGLPAGDARLVAFEVSAQEGALARVDARHVLVSGFDQTLAHWRGGGGRVELAVQHSLLDVRGGADSRVELRDGGPEAVIDVATTVRTGDPRFSSPATGDFRLGDGSPAIDVGGADLLAGEPVDLAGFPRPADGDGDGTAAVDAGAYEAPPIARPHVPVPDPPRTEQPGCCAPPPAARPRVAAFGLRPSRVVLGARRAAAFRVRLLTAGRVAIAIERRVRGRWRTVGTLAGGVLAPGTRRIPFRARVGRRALAPGRYRATVVVTAANGLRSAPRRVGFTVVAGAPSPRAPASRARGRRRPVAHGHAKR